MNDLSCESCAASGLERLSGLSEFLEWAKARGLKMAAVTNAPKAKRTVDAESAGLRRRVRGWEAHLRAATYGKPESLSCHNTKF